METKEAVDRLTQRWKEARMKIRPGVSAEQFAQFEEKFQAWLGPDIHAYFEAVNGMELDEMDSESHIRFWPLEEVKPLQEAVEAPWAAGYTGYYLFADYLLWSHGYAIDLSPTGQGTIVMVGGESPQVVASSFAEFMYLCLDEPDNLHRSSATRAHSPRNAGLAGGRMSGA